MKRESILRKLSALDFMTVDLQLFLDTHPNDNDAINIYNKICHEADKVRMEYENNYGPLCSYRSVSADGWKWIDNPWPWESQFNTDF